jgi:hypothetical protein
MMKEPCFAVKLGDSSRHAGRPGAAEASQKGKALPRTEAGPGRQEFRFCSSPDAGFMRGRAPSPLTFSGATRACVERKRLPREVIAGLAARSAYKEVSEKNTKKPYPRLSAQPAA